jgi:hypothetical protein
MRKERRDSVNKRFDAAHNTVTIELHANLVRTPSELSHALLKVCRDDHYTMKMCNDMYIITVQRTHHQVGSHACRLTEIEL